MASCEAKIVRNPPGKTQKYFFGAQLCLRILAVVASLSATWLMVTNKEATQIFGMNIEARYSYSSAFKFFAFANAVACAFSVLSLFLAVILGRQDSDPSKFFFLFLHDLIVTCLVLAGCAAATAVGYVAQYGNSQTGWVAICGQFGKFCKRGAVSVALSYASFLFFFVLAIISANKSRQRRV